MTQFRTPFLTKLLTISKTEGTSTCYSSWAFMWYRFRSCALKIIGGVSRTKCHTKHLEQTDGQTDRQTDRQTDKLKTMSPVRGISYFSNASHKFPFNASIGIIFKSDVADKISMTLECIQFHHYHNIGIKIGMRVTVTAVTYTRHCTKKYTKSLSQLGL